MPAVLVVDDEADMRALLRAVIERANEGLKVVGQAASGREAIDCWRLTGADVILLDQRMPGMTGLETAEHILAEHPTQNIVLFSAFLDEDTVRRASELGIRACMSKSDLAQIPEALWKYAAA